MIIINANSLGEKKTSIKNREYFTLVSEFMLQQTQVATVVPYFINFVKIFPNLKFLANANEKEVLKNWEGLGYYSRARNLKKTAVNLLINFKGRLSKDIEKLKKSLPGIGDYTSQDQFWQLHITNPIFQWMVMLKEFLRGYFCLKKEISKENLKKKKFFFGYSKRSSDYAQAIMELGALICKPTLPACSLCPITENCNAFKKKDFIIRAKNKLNKVKYFEANIYKQKNKFLLIKNKKFNFFKKFGNFSYGGNKPKKI